MKLTVNYLHPGMTEPLVSVADPEANNFDFWINHMTSEYPDTIFFYTTETTDIFEEDT